MISESKATRLASQIQMRIEQDGLEPGTPVGTKADLVAQYKVAPGTLNEALRLLQNRGYLELRVGPRGGAFVAQTVGRLKMSHTLLAVQDDPQQLADAFQAQDALEEHIAMGAAAVCGPDDVPRLRRALEQLRAAAHDPAQVLSAIWEIDRQIALTSPNKFLSEMYCLVLDNIEIHVDRWPSVVGGERPMARIHEELVLAVIRNDVEAAQRLAHEHSPIDYLDVARETRNRRTGVQSAS
ncbi:FadR/GntR family transcriptional regulator [Arthrobacter sp. TB 26]|uniref:FadR/GntR family transcriptional regulator n=1 Tax=Arthrobacter sp. TB 26 TaxID=494420 RepID=UPI00046270E8|nr:FCD domain-containing protein [Arthrobacter sp. TB 26]